MIPTKITLEVPASFLLFQLFDGLEHSFLFQLSTLSFTEAYDK